MKNINILKDLKTLNELHTSSVKSHTTNNGIVDFTCDNAGYVDNVAIEGKTLVNLWDAQGLKLGGQSSIVGNRYKCVTSASNRYSDFWTSYSMLKPNTTYTVTYNIIQNTLPTGVRAIAITRDHAKTPHAFNETVEVNGGVTGIFTAKLTTKDSFTDVAYGLRSFVDNSTMGDGYVVELEIVLIEGDYTNTPISYFEGLKSVGQGDKIEVLTYNKTNNLIEDTFTYTKDVAINYINGEFRSVTGHYACDNYIKIEPSTDYMFVGINANRAYYDENKQVVPPINNSYLQILLDKTNGSKKNFAVEKSPPNARYIKISIHKDNLVGGKAYLYKSSNYDHKQIPTTLRSLPNGVRDTIEKRGNKYVKVQRCGEVTLNGSENWNWVASFNNVIRYSYFIGGIAYKPSEINCNSDKFKAEKNELWNNNSEQIDVGNGDISINVMKNKLSNTSYTDSLNIKTWLQANPITVVYELATPQIIELPNFNPQTYKGGNTLLINSGVVQCDASFDMCEGIRSELDVIKNKVSSLDDTTTTINYRNLRDDITFLNGWNIWGNEARFNCYVADNIVKICILLKPSVLTQYTPIFKLPAQYITGRKEFVTCVDNNMRCYMGSLDETCMFTFENEISSESKYVSINFTYPLIKKVI